MLIYGVLNLDKMIASMRDQPAAIYDVTSQLHMLRCLVLVISLPRDNRYSWRLIVSGPCV